MTRVLGAVDDCSVRSRAPIGHLLEGLRAAFGGEPQGFQGVMGTAGRRSRLSPTPPLGVNAVPTRGFDSGEFGSAQGQAMNEVVAYGTAVILER